MSYTYEKLAELSFQIITYAGMAKSNAMEALYAAKEGNFETAKEKMHASEESMHEAARQHTDLVQKEAQGERINIPVLLMHAEDQLLTTQTLMLMVEEMIQMHKMMQEKDCSCKCECDN